MEKKSFFAITERATDLNEDNANCRIQTGKNDASNSLHSNNLWCFHLSELGGLKSASLSDERGFWCKDCEEETPLEGQT